jgi:hypothetical protein
MRDEPTIIQKTRVKEFAKDLYRDVRDLRGENVEVRAESIIAMYLISLLAEADVKVL